MGVKRFDYILGTGPEEGWMEEAALGQYIKSADYDALAAALREVLSDDARYPSGWASIAKARALLGLTAETGAKYGDVEVYDPVMKIWVPKET